MIITRSPLRLPLGGGGTDLASYYRVHEGFLIAAAINKYVYITIHQTFIRELILKYSKLEMASSIDDIQHPIVREALRLVGITDMSIEITSMADIPAGTGLGSSGSFTTALLKALHCHHKNLVHPSELAAQACEIEIERLGEPIGKQDQYIAAYGGLTCFHYRKDESVEAYPLRISSETMYDLEDNLIIFFTGYSRSASTILKDQNDRSKEKDEAMLANLQFVKEIGLRTQKAFENGRLWEFADLMNQHWEYKRKRSGGISNPKIDEWYELGRANGALGGKLIGAGGGGFLMFYADDKSKLRHAMSIAGLREVRFNFDFEGTKVIVS